MRIQGPQNPPSVDRAASFKKMQAPGTTRDRVTLGTSSPEKNDPPNPTPPPPQRSLVGKLLRYTGLAGMAAATGLSALGGIAYQANKDVLHTAPTVYIYPQSLAADSAPTPTLSEQVLQATPSTTAKAAAPKTAPLQIHVPAATVQDYLHQLQSNPEVQKLLLERTDQARDGLQKEIGRVQIPPGTVLLDVTIPLPTGERSLLQVGKTDLPSLGFRALKSESVPLTLHYAVDPIQTGLQAEVRTVEADPTVQGPGLLLGAVEVSVRAPDGKIPLSGTMNFHDDLGGEATRSEISRLRAQGGQDKLIAQLQGRLAQSQRLQELGKDQGFGGLLASTSDQGLSFQAEVKTGKEPLVKTTLYLWAAPDRNGDGKADLEVTQVNQLETLDKVEVELVRLDGEGPRPSGWIKGMVHQKVQEALLKNLRQAVPQVAGQLQAQARDKTSQQLEVARAQLEDQANQELRKAYLEHGSVQVPGSGPVRVGNVQVTPQGVLVELDPGSGLSGKAVDTAGLKPGQFAVGINLDLVNQQLRQVDWKPILQQGAAKGGLQTLELGKDAKGQTTVPQILVRNGRLTLDADLSATLPGSSTALRTRILLPLKVETQEGKLIAGLDVSGVEFQKAQAKTGFDLSSLLPPKLLPGLFEKALGGKANEKVDLDLSSSAGVRFEDVRVAPNGSVTLVLRADPNRALK